MTSRPDIERLLDGWLAEGPNQVADRVLDDVADRIVRQPQRRAWRLHPWRPVPMSSNIRLVAIVGALLLAALGGVMLSGGGSGPAGLVPSPTTAPTPTPSPSPSPIALTVRPALAAGTYVGQVQAGRMVLTLPDGWSAPQVTAQDFALHLTSGQADDIVRVFFDMRRASRDPACPEAPASGITRTSRAIAQDLLADPNLKATSPSPVFLNGVQVQVVDVELAAGVKRTCPFSGGQPSVPLIVDNIDGEGAFWGVGPGERIRLVLFDAMRAHNVVVVIDSANGSSFDTLVEATMPIVQSMQFQPN